MNQFFSHCWATMINKTNCEEASFQEFFSSCEAALRDANPYHVMRSFIESEATNIADKGKRKLLIRLNSMLSLYGSGLSLFSTEELADAESHLDLMDMMDAFEYLGPHVLSLTRPCDFERLSALYSDVQEVRNYLMERLKSKSMGKYIKYTEKPVFSSYSQYGSSYIEIKEEDETITFKIKYDASAVDIKDNVAKQVYMNENLYMGYQGIDANIAGFCPRINIEEVHYQQNVVDRKLQPTLVPMLRVDSDRMYRVAEMAGIRVFQVNNTQVATSVKMTPWYHNHVFYFSQTAIDKLKCINLLPYASIQSLRRNTSIIDTIMLSVEEEQGYGLSVRMSLFNLLAAKKLYKITIPVCNEEKHRNEISKMHLMKLVKSKLGGAYLRSDRNNTLKYKEYVETFAKGQTKPLLLGYTAVAPPHNPYFMKDLLEDIDFALPSLHFGTDTTVDVDREEIEDDAAVELRDEKEELRAFFDSQLSNGIPHLKEYVLQHSTLDNLNNTLAGLGDPNPIYGRNHDYLLDSLEQVVRREETRKLSNKPTMLTAEEIDTILSQSALWHKQLSDQKDKMLAAFRAFVVTNNELTLTTLSIAKSMSSLINTMTKTEGDI